MNQWNDSEDLLIVQRWILRACHVALGVGGWGGCRITIQEEKWKFPESVLWGHLCPSRRSDSSLRRKSPGGEDKERAQPGWYSKYLTISIGWNWQPEWTPVVTLVSLYCWFFEPCSWSSTSAFSPGLLELLQSSKTHGIQEEEAKRQLDPN